MPFNLQDFHFVRPEYFWLLIPFIGILLAAKSYSKNRNAWHKVISPHLLKFLFIGEKQTKTRSGHWLALIITFISILAISGPSFRQKTVPVFETEAAQVILLDLSLSMDANDIKPSRLERAKFKLLDLLSETNEGTVGLVVYAGDAFVISPLTSDAKTVTNMVPTLSTGIMPVLGSRPDLAIAKSISLLENAKSTSGQIVWLTDGVEQKYVDSIVEQIQQTKFNLSILAIGTKQGAPIPLPNQNGFLKDSSGSIVVPKLQLTELNEIAKKIDAGLVQLTANSDDIEYLKELHQQRLNNDDNPQESEQVISRWIDDGYWLTCIILLLMLYQLISRKTPFNLNAIGVIALLTAASYTPNEAHALSWDDLWLTKDQQAKKAFEQGEFEQAASLFQNQQWRASSQYKQGEYSQAAENFKTLETENSQYNYATSLAKSGELQAALDEYNSLLEKTPDHEDAQYNKKIIEKLLEQQKQQQQQNQDNKDSDENKEEEQQDSQQDSDSQQKDNEQNESQQEQKEQEQEQQKQEQEQRDAENAENKEQQVELSKDERDKAEKDQALEHWLEKIPDDPGGLLRRKMYREYQERGRQQKEEKLW